MDRNKIKELHGGSFNNLIKILRIHNSFAVNRSPLILSIILSLVFTYAAYDSAGGKGQNEMILHAIDISLSIFPDLLGFTLAGLTIIIAFGNTSYLKSLSKIKFDSEDIKPSLFQRIVAVFTWAVLVQSATIICSLFYILIHKTYALSNLFLPIELKTLISSFGLFLILQLIIYSALLLPKTILNVFRFGQGHHFKLFIENQNDPSEPKEN